MWGDEFFLAENLCSDLQGVGAIVVGPAPSVRRALDLITATPAMNATVLDVDLSGEMAYAAADALLARSVPFVFTSSYDDGVLDKRYPQMPRRQKPVEFRAIAEALPAVLAG